MRRSALTLAALLSGAAGLLYQEMWARSLRLSFGGTSEATGTVLAAFVGGIGLGSVLLGRRVERSPRPARLYAAMELGIALYGILSLPILGLVDRAYASLYDPLTSGSGHRLLRLALSLGALAAPTLLMGGTLPALSATLTREGDTGRSAVGWAYGANTLGAMAGALAGAFVLLGALGMTGTVLVAVAANLAAAALAWQSRDETRPATPPAERRSPPLLLATAALVSGASVIALEVVWTRTLAGLLGGAHRVFALMLAAVLLGIGGGGLAYARLFAARAPTRAHYAWTIGLQAAGALTLLALAGPIADLLYLTLPLPLGGSGLTLLAAVILLAVALPTSLCAGVGYPMLAALARPGPGGVSADVGALGLASAVGSLVGALATSLLLVPLLGTHGSLRLFAALPALVALAFTLGQPRLWLVRALALAVLVVALLPGPFPARFVESSVTTLSRLERLPTDRSLAEFRLRSRRLREHFDEGVEATAIVLRTDSQRAMYVNGKPDASSWRDMGTQTLVGALPAVLRPDARRALVIGLGSGTSAGWLAASPRMAQVDVAELEPAMVRAARLFERFHPPALGSRKVRVLIEDGRSLVRGAPRRYDVIASEPSNPWLGGASALYTREFYEGARRHLGERGVFAQWLQTYGIDARSIAVVLRTFTAVFPHAALVYSGSQDVVLVGSSRPLELAPERLGERLRALGAFPALAARMGLAEPEDLAGCVLAAEDGLRALAHLSGGVVHTDDNAWIEVRAGQSLLHGADHVTSIVRAPGRLPSLLAALGLEASAAPELFARQARCLSRDAPDAARHARRQAQRAGLPATAPAPAEPPASLDEARRALDALRRQRLFDPQEASRIVEGLTRMGAGGTADAATARALLERGFPAGVLFLTRAQIVLELALAAGEEAACRRAAGTLVSARVLEIEVLEQARSCLAGGARETADALLARARAVTPRGITGE